LTFLFLIFPKNYSETTFNTMKIIQTSKEIHYLFRNIIFLTYTLNNYFSIIILNDNRTLLISSHGWCNFMTSSVKRDLYQLYH